MRNVFISLCVSLFATAALAGTNPMDGNWQGPCIALEEGKSANQTIKFHAHNPHHGFAVITLTDYLDANCGTKRFYRISKMAIDLRKSELGDGIWEIDATDVTNKENTLFDIVKFEEVNGFVRATFGEAASEKDPSKRPTVFSTRDRIYFKFTNNG